MTTGGRGITPERARQAADAGLSTVSVSIDGLEATHDRLRAVKGSHRAALAALRNFADAGLPISVARPVTKYERKALAGPVVAELLWERT